MCLSPKLLGHNIVTISIALSHDQQLSIDDWQICRLQTTIYISVSKRFACTCTMMRKSLVPYGQKYRISHLLLLLCCESLVGQVAHSIWVASLENGFEALGFFCLFFIFLLFIYSGYMVYMGCSIF